MSNPTNSGKCHPAKGSLCHEREFTGFREQEPPRVGRWTPPHPGPTTPSDLLPEKARRADPPFRRRGADRLPARPPTPARATSRSTPHDATLGQKPDHVTLAWNACLSAATRAYRTSPKRWETNTSRVFRSAPVASPDGLIRTAQTPCAPRTAHRLSTGYTFRHLSHQKIIYRRGPVSRA